MEKIIISIFNNAPVTAILFSMIFVFSCAGLINKKIFYFFLLYPYGITRQREFYRTLTADLVHNDVLHFLFNETVLYLFCTDLEETLKARSAWGSLQFLSIYLSSYFAGTIFVTIKYRNDFKFSTAGASGSIIGCMLSFMIFAPHYTGLYLPFLGKVENMYMVIGYIIMMFVYRWRSKNEMINHEVHLLGAFGGVIAAVVIRYLI